MILLRTCFAFSTKTFRYVVGNDEENALCEKKLCRSLMLGFSLQKYVFFATSSLSRSFFPLPLCAFAVLPRAYPLINLSPAAPSLHFGRGFGVSAPVSPNRCRPLVRQGNRTLRHGDRAFRAISPPRADTRPCLF